MASEHPSIHPAPVSALILKLKSFREIGPKMAERLAYEIVRSPKHEVDSFIDAVSQVRDSIRFCGFCRGYSDSDTCHICSDGSRDKTRLCIVESPDDIIAIERTKSYRGLYYSLSDSMSASRRKGLDRLVLVDLVEKIRAGSFSELIIATNMDLDGDLAANMLKETFAGVPGIRISRLAFGLPVGADIKLADSATLVKSFEGRSEL